MLKHPLFYSELYCQNHCFCFLSHRLPLFTSLLCFPVHSPWLDLQSCLWPCSPIFLFPLFPSRPWLTSNPHPPPPDIIWMSFVIVRIPFHLHCHACLELPPPTYAVPPPHIKTHLSQDVFGTDYGAKLNCMYFPSPLPPPCCLPSVRFLF